MLIYQYYMEQSQYLIYLFKCHDLKNSLYHFFNDTNAKGVLNRYDLQFIINNYHWRLRFYRKEASLGKLTVDEAPLFKEEFFENKFYKLLNFDEETLNKIKDHSGDINGFLLGCLSGSFATLNNTIFFTSEQIGECNVEGSNGLHLAAENGHDKLVSELLNRNLKFLVIAKDNEGRTPLHCAVYREHAIVVTQLIGFFKSKASLHAYLNEIDSTNRTALQIATEKGSHEIVDIIQNALN